MTKFDDLADDLQFYFVFQLEQCELTPENLVTKMQHELVVQQANFEDALERQQKYFAKQQEQSTRQIQALASQVEELRHFRDQVLSRVSAESLLWFDPMLFLLKQQYELVDSEDTMKKFVQQCDALLRMPLTAAQKKDVRAWKKHISENPFV